MSLRDQVSGLKNEIHRLVALQSPYGLPPLKVAFRAAAKVALSRSQRNPKTVASMMSHLRRTLAILEAAEWSLESLAGLLSGGTVSKDQGRRLQTVLRRVTVAGEDATALKEVSTQIECLPTAGRERGVQANPQRDSLFLFWDGVDFMEEVLAERGPVTDPRKYKRLNSGIIAIFTHLFPLRAGCITEMKISAFAPGNVVPQTDDKLVVIEVLVPKTGRKIHRAYPMWVCKMVLNYVAVIRARPVLEANGDRLFLTFEGKPVVAACDYVRSEWESRNSGGSFYCPTNCRRKLATTLVAGRGENQGLRGALDHSEQVAARHYQLPSAHAAIGQLRAYCLGWNEFNRIVGIAPNWWVRLIYPLVLHFSN